MIDSSVEVVEERRGMVLQYFHKEREQFGFALNARERERERERGREREREHRRQSSSSLIHLQLLQFTESKKGEKMLRKEVERAWKRLVKEKKDPLSTVEKNVRAFGAEFVSRFRAMMVAVGGRPRPKKVSAHELANKVKERVLWNEERKRMTEGNFKYENLFEASLFEEEERSDDEDEEGRKKKKERKVEKKIYKKAENLSKPLPGRKMPNKK